MSHLVLSLWTILNDAGQWLALVALGSVVLRRERQHRRDDASMRRTHDAIMREVACEPFDSPTGVRERIAGFHEPTVLTTGGTYTEVRDGCPADDNQSRACGRAAGR